MRVYRTKADRDRAKEKPDLREHRHFDPTHQQWTVARWDHAKPHVRYYLRDEHERPYHDEHGVWTGTRAEALKLAAQLNRGGKPK